MNPFYTSTEDQTAYLSGLAVTPNDGADLVPPSGPARPTRGIIVGGAGTIALVMADGNTVSVSVPATAIGFVIPLAVNRIKATGTTATSITAWY
jgi:hypothetical protein